MQAQEIEAQQATLGSELKAMRKAVADDNEELILRGVKGVTAAQELISTFCSN